MDIPSLVSCFVYTANRELPLGFSAKLWAADKTVDIIENKERVYTFFWEDIERDISGQLNLLEELY